MSTQTKKLHTVTGEVIKVYDQSGKAPGFFGLLYEEDGSEKKKYFKVWTTEYQSSTPSTDYLRIQQAAEDGSAIAVSYSNSKNNKDEWESWVDSVEVVGGAAPIANPSSEPAPVPPSATNGYSSIIEACCDDIEAATKLLRDLAKKV